MFLLHALANSSSCRAFPAKLQPKRRLQHILLHTGGTVPVLVSYVAGRKLPSPIKTVIGSVNTTVMAAAGQRPHKAKG